MADGIRVKIIGDHPWTGFTGRLVSVGKPLSFLRDMGKVVFDDDQETHGTDACFAEAKNLKALEQI